MIYSWLIEWKRSPGMGTPGYEGEFTMNTLTGGEEGRLQARKRAFDKIERESMLVPNVLTVTEL